MAAKFLLWVDKCSLEEDSTQYLSFLCMLLSMNPGYDTEVCRTGDPMNAC
jgi:hypothetical protein